MYVVTVIDEIVTLACKGRERTLDAMESAIFRVRMTQWGRSIPKDNYVGIITERQERQAGLARRFLLGLA